MPGKGPRPCGRQSMACRVAEPLWMRTVSGPLELWPQAVATVNVRTSHARTNACSFVIWHSPITRLLGCDRPGRNWTSILEVEAGGSWGGRTKCALSPIQAEPAHARIANGSALVSRDFN